MEHGAICAELRRLNNMNKCDSCKKEAPLTAMTDMFGNEGNVCAPCFKSMEEDGCVGCGS